MQKEKKKPWQFTIPDVLCIGAALFLELYANVRFLRKDDKREGW